MAIQLHKKIFGQNSIVNMPHFSVNSPSWWNSTIEHQLPMSLSKNLSLKVGCTPEYGLEPKFFGAQSQQQDQDSSSTQLTSQSHPEVTVVGGTDSQDQCISSDSVQVESQRKRVEGQMKPALFMGNPGFGVNNLQVDSNQSLTHNPYAYADPFVGGLYTSYGPQAIVAQIPPLTVGGVGPTRVPLPLDLAEDGPIYVNAKQYHGILRRRQVRAKLEAQNKLVKNRKPYLHESRHRHAVNRVRGSGGRFLSTKNPKSSSGNNSGNTPAVSGVSHVINGRGSTIFNHQMDRRFSGISPYVLPAGD